jgi:hypothetical protein
MQSGGALMQVVAERDGERFQEVTVTEIAFDRTIPEERFSLEPPRSDSI